jgi:NADH:ubiquinone oxidoreductase subunit 6 (subunit J)
MQWWGLTAEQWLEGAGFVLSSAIVFISALGVLFAPRILHAAVWLMACLVGVAGYYALLGAHLLFALQILVYVGAIAVLIVFAVLLLERGRGGGMLGGSQHLLAGLLAAGMLLVVMVPVLVLALWRAAWPSGPACAGALGSVALVGRAFLTRHLLAFELISVVLLVAMIGALVLARPPRHPPASPNRSDAEPKEAAAKEGRAA